jgi:hypothetical protein
VVVLLVRMRKIRNATDSSSALLHAACRSVPPLRVNTAET